MFYVLIIKIFRSKDKLRQKKKDGPAGPTFALRSFSVGGLFLFPEFIIAKPSPGFGGRSPQSNNQGFFFFLNLLSLNLLRAAPSEAIIH